MGGITLIEAVGALIKNNVIYDNHASGGTGAIQITKGSYDSIAYNTIYGNMGFREVYSAGTGDGIQIYNNTICPLAGYGIWNYNRDILIVKNNIIFNCQSTAIFQESGYILAKYNCTFKNSSDYNFTPGTGNIYEDAGFVDTTNHDYRLTEGSPCVNAGDPNPLLNDPDGSRNDMGAFPLILPDFTITGIVHDDTIRVGDTGISFYIGLNNQGSTMTDSLCICLFLSDDTIIGDEDDFELAKDTQCWTGKWLSGYGYYKALAIDMPTDMTCGIYYVGVKIDCPDAIQEFNESNNSYIENNASLIVKGDILSSPNQPQYAVGCGFVDISWSPLDSATEYCIYRDGIQIACQSDTAWKDNDPGTVQRCYAITARNDCPGESEASPSSCAIAKSIPSIPDQPLVTANCGYIDISWDSINNADSFYVYRDGAEIICTSGTTWRDNSPGQNQRCYTITAKNECGESTHSPQSCATAGSALSAPNKPIITAGCESIDLSWGSVSGATYYCIYQDGNWMTWLYGTTWHGNFVDASQKCYTITARNDCGESGQSPQACTTIITVPNASAITPSVSPQVPQLGAEYTISWVSVPGATTYCLYENNIRIDSGAFRSKKFTKHNNGAYRYDISACNECGCGDRSNQNVIDIKLDVAENDTTVLPDVFAVAQNYPNSFNSVTEIRFDIPHASHVSLEIYDIMGRKVAIVADQNLSVGQYTASWDGKDMNGQNVASGIYLYRLTAGEFTDTKKMILLK